MDAKHQTQPQSFLNAFRGIAATIRTQLHMKVHVAFALVALAACALLAVDALGWCLVIACIGIVFAAELFNSALEALADKACPEYDPLIGFAKDAAAGAVLVVAIASVAIGLIVYIPALLRLVG